MNRAGTLYCRFFSRRQCHASETCNGARVNVEENDEFN